MSGQKPREIAAQVLGQVRFGSGATGIQPLRRTEGDFVEALLEQALAQARLSPPDRRLCQELAYGVVRWQLTLDWLIGRKTESRTQKPALQNLLRLGLYQIFWLERIPAHAAVHETVQAARESGFGPQAGFVNAVLRGYLREFDSSKLLLNELKTKQPHLGYSHPEWLVNRWRTRYGAEDTARLLAWNNTPPETFARINTLKADPGKLLLQWRAEDVDYDFVRADWLEENSVFKLKSHPPLADLPSFQQGLFYVQDPSTLLAPRALAAQPGEYVLDLCAAPGGKLGYLAQLMGNEGRIVAHDPSPDRLKLLEQNCTRLGVTCAQPVSTLPAPPSRSLMVAAPEQFDKILVDAPCSNTGVMRRRVELRWRIRPEEIQRLRSAQLALLEQAAKLLKKGGMLVYSTCSLEPEENRQVVDEFLGAHPEFKLEGERALSPFRDGVDGAYIAELKRVFAEAA